MALFGNEQFAVFVVVFVHAEDLHGAFQIFERHHGVRFAAFLGDALLHGGDQAADARQAAVRQLRQRDRCCASAYLFQNRRKGRQRMAGDVKAEQFFFVREQFVLRPFGQIAFASGMRRRFFLQQRRTASFARVAGPEMMLAARASVRSICANRVARVSPKAIAGAGFDERFQDFAVHGAAIDALAQVRERLEFAAFVARFQECFPPRLRRRL